MPCIMRGRMCQQVKGLVNVEEKCEYCGFDQEEYNRRIRDIRLNGLQYDERGLRRYVVTRPGAEKQYG